MNTTTTSPAQDLLSHTLAFCDDCLNHQDFTGARQALCRALTLAPNRADILSHRGRLALFLKDTETAQRDFAAALELDPHCSAAWSGLARYHMQQGEPAEAEAAANRALGIDPADEEAAHVKAELEAELCKAPARESSNIDSRETSVECKCCELSAGADPVSKFADWPWTTETKLSNRPVRGPLSEVSIAGTAPVFLPSVSEKPPPCAASGQSGAPRPAPVSLGEAIVKETRVGIAVVAEATYEPTRVRQLITEAISLCTGDDRGISAFVRGGERVLIKPNWVLHRNNSGAGMDCMVTHSEFIVATVELVAASQPTVIVIGDAPLQGCQWDKLVTPELTQRIRAAAAGVPVEIVDFRRTVMAGNSLSADVRQELRPLDRYVLFDLGVDSLLEPVTGDGNFRVTMYDPDKLAKTHCRGSHQYLLAKDVFEADVVINLPKLKTHRKSGLTAALKNLVGINGNKDYLPHHRIGGSDVGGDCYPGFVWWKHAAELYLDAANRAIGTPTYDVWVGRAGRLFDLFGRHYDTDIEGGWHGNDTCWRMNLDLNRCLLYGDAEGRLHDTVQRRVLSLTDGIICGQGEGPLSPLPLPVGAVTFSENAAAADLAHGALLRLDFRKVPLLRGCFERMRLPVLPEARMPAFVTRQGRLDYEQLAAAAGRSAEVPRGWKGHCEITASAPQSYESCTA
jgi:uncharacterized protein (DUF362 family)/Tfp pilus assembly protein PilF